MDDQQGKYCYEGYHHRDTACPECHLLASFREGRAKRRVTSTNHSRRGLLHVEIIASPLSDGNGTIIAGIEVVRDITERKLMDDKLNAITCDLEQKTWKLMAANKELESFSYTLSHDMKNSLARISLAADALTTVSAPSLDETGRFLLGTISESCHAMDEMIEAILRLSATTQGGISLDHVDLGPLAHEVALELRCQYPDHPVAFTAGDGLVTTGDRQLLKVMLRNLLGNSWKYTEGMASPTVSLSAEDHDAKIIFVVRDNGRGFDMHESERLFKPFSRLSGSAGTKGSGIGLATVRRIILCHGGEIWGEGRPGGGAEFYFALPTSRG
jgi:signal transduction histidine kinase